MSAPTSSAGPSMEFVENEKVLCYHGPLLYEAKVLKCKRFHKNSPSPSKGPHYFVHYRGWKSSWDEWVHQDRMLKWDEKNLAVQKKLADEQRATKDGDRKPEKEKSNRGHQHRESISQKDKEPLPKEPKPAKPPPRAKKAVKEEEGYGTELYNWNPPVKKKVEVKLVVPEKLKAVMVDDWEAVTRNGQLVPLPRQPCIEDILLEFQELLWTLPVSGGPSRRDENVPLFLIGIKAYFEEALGAHLLYRFERPQYADMLRKYAYGPNVSPEQVKSNTKLYGAEHLLRLLVTLPYLMASTPMDMHSMNIIREYSNHLLEFLAKNKDRFFLTQYEDTSSTYLSLARG
ncbi:SubName: Full=Related to Chromo domain protein MRG15 {ECO:0000313/EMBL:CCA70973.1} [Serendipita indica DSM 11827]|uniref:Chromatin modification-related protein EAF3 n=1 Tax=Serendipita indica (strain DSM 11827) TaxID=1109443 RepID=G4TI30_SERID|nr:SubName: Full=Related to Chromo domain protein MRG15 {ECO:0000313/EMBL:CCA70973.1} [Serendipita indica DSM 11827]CCA70973.1 related to Chromo domain protein MRG15 [Serendipita indica DSM 11827]